MLLIYWTLVFANYKVKLYFMCLMKSSNKIFNLKAVHTLDKLSKVKLFVQKNIAKYTCFRRAYCTSFVAILSHKLQLKLMFGATFIYKIHSHVFKLYLLFIGCIHIFTDFTNTMFLRFRS